MATVDAGSNRGLPVMTMLDVRQLPLGGNLSDFLQVVETVYRDDPRYIRPLDFELKERLSAKRNPFFEHAEGTIFTAHRDGKCVGRITAQVDHEHLRRHQDATGFFGFFDTIDDESVARALLNAAETWLRSKGVTRARGPASPSPNEEYGCLVEGFDTPPMILCPHHRPYQSVLLEKAGYTKEKDLYGWQYTVGTLNARVQKAHAAIVALPEVSARRVSVANIGQEVERIVDIYNDAWSDNWGFVPATHNEVRKMAKDFKTILMPDLSRILTINGEDAAVAVAFPNLNEMIGDLHGSLFPTGIFKLLYRLKIVGPRSARLIILGVRKKYRNVRRYAGLSAYLYAEMNESGRKLGIPTGELGWTLEDNGPVNTAIKMLGGKVYKKYRVYIKDIAN